MLFFHKFLHSIVLKILFYFRIIRKRKNTDFDLFVISSLDYDALAIFLFPIPAIV